MGTFGNMKTISEFPAWCIGTTVDGKHSGQVRARAVRGDTELYDVLLADGSMLPNVTRERMVPQPPIPTAR